MINKTPIGIPFFDTEFGGIYRSRVALVTGRSESGKTTLGLQYLAQGLRMHESGLMLSARRSHDLAITADSLGLPVAQAIDTGMLTFLEYSEFVPGRDRESSIMLPPDGFIQLKEIIESNAVQRVVIDTVLPWVTLPEPSHLAEHVFSLVRAFERLGVTALFMLPKPVSVAASRLRKMLEDVVPISITLAYETEKHTRQWLVTKYLGMNLKAEGTPFDVLPREGIVPRLPVAPSAPPPAPVYAPRAEEPAPSAAVPVAAPRAEEPPRRAAAGKTSFASLVLEQPAPGARPSLGGDIRVAGGGS